MTETSEGSDTLEPDELAGVVDLFGALTRPELERACAELAYRRGVVLDGDDGDGTDPAAALDRALREYYLVEYDREDGTYLTVGPVAFPTLPADAEDLPHILDVSTRALDREALAESVERRLRADAARAVADDDRDRIRHLLDVTYDLEAWAPVDVAAVRARLDDALASLDEAE